MRIFLIAVTILMGACSYSKPELDKAFTGINQEFTRQLNHITVLNNRVFAKEIAKCKAENAKGINLATGECTK